MTVWQVVLKGLLLGQVETRNVFHWSVTNSGEWDNAFCLAIDSKMSNLLETVAELIAYPGWTSYALEVKKWDGETFFPIYETPFAFPGTSTGEDLSSFQTAILIKFTTSVFKAAGRKFLAGISELWTGNGSLVVTALTDCADFIVELMTPVSVAPNINAYAGVWTKNHVFAAFNGGIVGTILSEIRRRKPGYGI